MSTAPQTVSISAELADSMDTIGAYMAAGETAHLGTDSSNRFVAAYREWKAEATEQDGILDNRSTAFVAGLQQARIDALEAALRRVDEYMAGDGWYEANLRCAVLSALA